MLTVSRLTGGGWAALALVPASPPGLARGWRPGNFPPSCAARSRARCCRPSGRFSGVKPTSNDLNLFGGEAIDPVHRPGKFEMRARLENGCTDLPKCSSTRLFAGINEHDRRGQQQHGQLPHDQPGQPPCEQLVTPGFRNLEAELVVQRLRRGGDQALRLAEQADQPAFVKRPLAPCPSPADGTFPGCRLISVSTPISNSRPMSASRQIQINFAEAQPELKPMPSRDEQRKGRRTAADRSRPAAAAANPPAGRGSSHNGRAGTAAGTTSQNIPRHDPAAVRAAPG